MLMDQIDVAIRTLTVMRGIVNFLFLSCSLIPLVISENTGK